MADDSPTPSTEPAGRGELVVHDRVVEKLALHTALRTPGVVPHRPGMTKVAERKLPRARVQISGRVVAVDLEIAVGWGTRLNDVASDVRRDVASTLQSLAGLEVTRVTVNVSRILPTRNESRVQ